MANVAREKCAECPSVYIVFEDDGSLCPRCERNELRAKVARLESRGIEDLRHSNKGLEEFATILTHGIPDRCDKLRVLLRNGDGVGVWKHLEVYVAALATEALDGRLSFPAPREAVEIIDDLQDDFDYGDARATIEAAFNAGVKFQKGAGNYE